MSLRTEQSPRSLRDGVQVARGQDRVFCDGDQVLPGVPKGAGPLSRFAHFGLPDFSHAEKNNLCGIGFRGLRARSGADTRHDGAYMNQSDYEQVKKVMEELVSKEPNGIRIADLAHAIRESFEGTEVEPRIGHGKLGPMIKKYMAEPNPLIYKPKRGLYRHKQFQEKIEPESVPSPEKTCEEKFYQPFADWLVDDLEECTKAIPVGGNKLKEKFGTPDVVGIFRPNYDDIIGFPMEIVSAELKTSTDGLITAFGQACSYKLFSHKSYIVVPRTALPEDIGKLESLCLICGIGLILFDPDSPANPDFQIRTRAVKHDPDMFYVNQKIRPIGKDLLG